jgi:Xaa-Pro aminopeptidase
MKTDLDALMLENDLDALLITGPGQHNPAMVYMTGIGNLTNADLIKKRGEEALLFHFPMERGEAARSGLKLKNIAEYHFEELLKQYEGDQLRATVKRYHRMLDDAGVTSGNVALYGRAEIGSNFAIFSALQQELTAINLVGEIGTSAMMMARLTKDEHEIARILNMGKITTQVVGQVAEFISAHKAKNGVLVKSDGEPLTIGEVKARINLWLSELGAENPEGTIFSIGHDAGVPHSTGNAGDLLRLGQTIVFDIFPCEAGGGYFYDFTRTWCLGQAPDDVLALYQDVLSVYQAVTAQLEVGKPFKQYQELTCQLFAQQGHPTIKETPQTQVGYVHSLGHGIGLNIHERPWSGTGSDEKDCLLPGTVFTIEPGLYYPEKGMGVRLENSFWAKPDGHVEVLADYPLDLVLPIKTA